MNSRILAVLSLLVAAPAEAGSYEDFNAGVATLGHGDSTAAISLFTRALDAGDLPPNLKPVAYLDRARAFLLKNQSDKALADAASALALKPDLVEAYILRARTFATMGQSAEAIAEYTSAIQVKPDSFDLYLGRGELRWEFAKFPESAADFDHAHALNSEDAYALIWRTLAAGRGGPIDNEALKEETRSLDLYHWPGPVLKVFIGRWTAEELLRRVEHRADEFPLTNAKRMRCEANFYMAEWHLLAREFAMAKPLFQAATAGCSHDAREFRAARIELDRTSF